MYEWLLTTPKAAGEDIFICVTLFLIGTKSRT
jgi:hypothetical protein